MTRTRYLYDFDPAIIRDMPNLESLYYRKQHAKLLIAKLVDVHYSSRDEVRISAIFSAIKWLDRAIKELT